MTTPVGYNAGTAFLTVVPSFRNIQRELGEIAEQIGRRIDRGLVNQLPRTMRNAARNANRAGADYGRRFGADAEREIRAAMNRIPGIVIPTTDAERRIRNVRRELAALRPARVGIDFDDRTFLRRLHAAQRELDELIDDDQTIHVRAELEQARDQIRNFLARDMVDQSRVAGGRAGGEFGRLFAERVRRSATALEIEPRFNMSGAEFRLFQLSQQLRALSNQTIGVDLDAGQAIAQLRTLQAQLAWLALNSPDVEIRTNAARAAAELMAILQLAQRIDGMDVNIDTDAAGAGMRRLAQNTDIPIHRLGVLIALGLSIGPIIVPAAAAASVAIAGIATAALAAVSGVGVLILALSGVFKAVQALDKYQKDADKSAKSLAASQTAVANASDGVRSAERSLANTRASVEAANRRAARAVAEAQEAVTDAVRDRQRAEEDLVEAIKAAQRADEDRRRSIRGNALDIRQANLDIAEAKRELDKVLANPRASEEEREQARITYEQRVLNLEDLQARQKDLAEEQDKWNREGVNGSDQVKAAQDRLRSATEKVADANERVAVAIESQQDTQRNGAYQLEQATQSLVSAQRSLQQATVNAGVAGGEALDNLREAMESLSPAGQRFAEFVYGLKDEFIALRRASEEALLPGLQRGLQELLRYMPGISDFVSRIGTAVGDSFEWAIRQMRHPEWQRFFRHISQTAVPAWEGLVRFGEAFSRGLASLIVTLSAFNGSMGRGAIEWAEGFARWAEKLDESEGFQRFLTYVAKEGPAVLEFLRELFEFAKRLIIAWAPVGATMLDILTAILRGINSLPLGTLTVLLTIIAGLSAAMLLFKGVGVLWRAVSGTIATGARVVTGAFRTLNTIVTGNTNQTTRYYRSLQLIHRGFAALPGVVGRSTAAVTRFMAASATGARVAALLGATAALNAYRTAVGRLSATFTPAAARVSGFFAAFGTRVSSAPTAALGAYRTAVARLSGVLTTATSRMTAFMVASATGARVAALVGATAAVGAYRSAVATLPGVLPAVTSRVSAFMSAVTGRVSLIAAAARSMGTYRAAFSGLAAALIPVTLRSGTFFANLAAGAGATGRANAAQRLFNRTLLDARIIMATANARIAAMYTTLRGTSVVGAATTAWRGLTTAYAATTGAIGSASLRIAAMYTLLRGSSVAVAASAWRGLTTAYAASTGVLSTLGPRLTAMYTSIRSGALFAGLATRAQAVFTGTLGAFSAAAGAAAGAAGRFATAVAGIGAAAVGGATRAIGGLVSVLGGPWGVALTAATIALGVFGAQAASQRYRNEELRDSLVELSRAYRLTDGSAMESIEGMVQQNRNLRELIINSQRYGLTLDEVVRAIEGDSNARNKVLSAYDAEIDRLKQLREQARWRADEEQFYREAGVKDEAALDKKIAGLEGERKAIAGATAERARSNQAAELLRQSNLQSQRDQEALNEAFRDGARAADILRQAYKSLYGDAQSREEALDAERAAYDRLAASVAKNGATLDENTEAGRENRQNMRDRIQTLADLAAADIAATGTISADTQARIDKLRQELIQMGFNADEVDRLIKIYMGVPPKILTEIILNGGANAQGVLNETGKKALEMIATYNLSPSEAMIIAKGGIPPGWRGPSPSALAQAEGGHIRGPGTETSDSIPALLSHNEFVQPAHAVRHYGVDVFEAMRHHRIPKEHLAGFAKGGVVDATGRRRFALGGYTGQKGTSKADVMGVASWPILHAYADKLWREKAAELEAWATAQAGSSGDFGPGPGFPPWPSSPGASRGDSGVWRSIVNLIKSTGPLSGSFGNAYRHGDPLWHGSGRAVDWMGFNQDALASFLAARRPLELIHRTSKRDYAYTRGVNKGSFNQTLMNQHKNHIHIAMKRGGLVDLVRQRTRVMDSGGWLEPGMNAIYNGLRSPEAVLTPTESAALVRIARDANTGGPRVVNQFEFRDTRLDPGKLAALNRAEAARTRAGRAW